MGRESDVSGVNQAGRLGPLYLVATGAHHLMTVMDPDSTWSCRDGRKQWD